MTWSLSALIVAAGALHSVQVVVFITGLAFRFCLLLEDEKKMEEEKSGGDAL